ncbi:hypothetical protein BLA29_007050 [Euroglyphus maynei]|uniref:Uncharacterized protein n=1 Tax=Euroglyphus maynei TaxID=6958 RepID=A0A1Y3BPX6_EURMA|nr:hypothetical protein BLA29_007050 [Euroglyphus maynei]
MFRLTAKIKIIVLRKKQRWKKCSANKQQNKFIILGHI